MISKDFAEDMDTAKSHEQFVKVNSQFNNETIMADSRAIAMTAASGEEASATTTMS